MRNNRYKLISFLLFTSVLIFCQTIAGLSQFNRIGEFIRAGEQNAEIFTKSYLQPVPNGFGADLNSGWFNSASTHRTLGFDIQTHGALAFVPSSDQSFNFNDLNLTNVELADGESPISPTAGGDSSIGPEVIIRDDEGEQIERFNLPKGSGFHFAPAPMIQASVGLIANTDIIARFVPKVKIGDYGNFNMRGFGLKHEINQWLPGGGLLPIDISVMAGYNRIHINADLNLEPREDALQINPTANYDNQQVETSFDTFTAKVLVGKDLTFISVYGGLGYEKTTMGLNVSGNYPVTENVIDPDTNQKIQVTANIHDPFSYSENGSNKFSFTGGLTFNLLFFNVFGEYTLADYPTANAGIGFSFR